MNEPEDKQTKINEQEQETAESQQNAEETLQNQCLEYKNKYLRALAEAENSRKRLQKEKHETIRFAIENTINDFLPIFDNFENALKFAQSSSDEIKNWATGFQMILSQFRDVLHDNGIVAFHSEGNIFDPHFHEAVEIVETNEYPDGTILEEYSKGYKSEKRTIRAAKVKVAKATLSEAEETPSENPTEEEPSQSENI